MSDLTKRSLVGSTGITLGLVCAFTCLWCLKAHIEGHRYRNRREAYRLRIENDRQKQAADILYNKANSLVAHRSNEDDYLRDPRPTINTMTKMMGRPNARSEEKDVNDP